MRFTLRRSGPLHFLQVDRRTITLDLSHVPGTLHDPSFVQVIWGPAENGEITREDGSKQPIWERALLTPYIVAFDNADKEAARAQAEFDAQ